MPLAKVLNDKDRKTICINVAGLVELHSRLYADLVSACKGGPGRTQRICSVFESHKLAMMREYAEYFASIDTSLEKCQSIEWSSSSSSSSSSQSPCGTQPSPGASSAPPPTPNGDKYLAELRAKLDECRKQSKRGNFKVGPRICDIYVKC